MANLKSAIKRVRTNRKKAQENLPFKSTMRTYIKRVEHFIKEEDKENAQQAFQEASKMIDRAIQKKVIHRNNGNRQKSRLAKQIRNIGS